MIGTIDSHPTGERLERIGELSKTPALWMLAKMRKTPLRHGGLDFMRKMLTCLAIRSSDDVVEFAPGLSLSARISPKLRVPFYVAFESDEAPEERGRDQLRRPAQGFVTGYVENAGLLSECTAVVFGKTMLAMQPAAMPLLEPRRVIRDNGLFGLARFVFNVFTHRKARSRMVEFRKLFRTHRYVLVRWFW